MLIIIKYLIMLSVCSESISINIPYREKNENLLSCVNLILDHYYQRKTITYVDMNYDGDEIVKIINTLPANIISRNNTKGMFTSNVEYVITAGIAKDFTTNFPSLMKEPRCNPYAKFLIIIKTLKGYDLTYIFDVLLKLHVKNVLLVNGTNEAELFTYNPFDNYNCGKKYDDIIKLGKCRNLPRKHLYPNKLVTGLRNCTFKATVAHWPPFAMDPNKTDGMIGVEQYAFQIISELEGFKVQYTESIDGEDFSTITDNTTPGNFLKLLAKRTDFIFGGMLLVDFRADAFNFICGHLPYIDDIRIFVPKAKAVKGWKNLILEFDCTVWLILFVTFFCYFTLLLVALRRKDKTFLFLVMLDLLFLHGNRIVSKSRGIFIIWVIYAYLINTYYQSSLVSITLNPIQNYQVSTNEDLIKYNMEDCVSKVLQKYIKVVRSEFSTQLHYHDECIYLMDSMRMISSTNNKYTVSLYSIYSYHKYLFFDDQGQEQIYTFKDPLNKVIYAIYFHKGFPMQERLNLLTIRLRENGLIDRYLRLLYDKRERLFVKIVPDSPHHCMYTFPWYILLIGYITAIASFVLEVFSTKLRRRCLGTKSLP